MYRCEKCGELIDDTNPNVHYGSGHVCDTKKIPSSDTQQRKVIIGIDGTNNRPCRMCRGIEQHHIKAVNTVVDEDGRILDGLMCPYHYCPNCGRKL